MDDPTALVGSGQLNDRCALQSVVALLINQHILQDASWVGFWMHRVVACMDGGVDEECTFSSRNVLGARGGATVDDIGDERPPYNGTCALG